MFFVLAKVFFFFVQPLGMVSLLLALSLILAMLRQRRAALASGTAAFLVLVLSAWSSLGVLALQPLETRFERPDPPPAEVAGIIVLGGFFEGRINLVRGGHELNSAADRIVEGAALARRYPEARIVVTGGTGALLVEGEGDAETAPRLLASLGIPPERIVTEIESRDTYENAAFTRALVDPQPGETWLLVTSAFHMPRSVLLFEQAGFEVVPWPTDYRSTGNEGLSLSRTDPVSTLQTTTIAIREWVGLLAYRLSGRTDRLLPDRR